MRNISGAALAVVLACTAVPAFGQYPYPYPNPYYRPPVPYGYGANPYAMAPRPYPGYGYPAPPPMPAFAPPPPVYAPTPVYVPMPVYQAAPPPPAYPVAPPAYAAAPAPMYQPAPAPAYQPAPEPHPAPQPVPPQPPAAQTIVEVTPPSPPITRVVPSPAPTTSYSLPEPPVVHAPAQEPAPVRPEPLPAPKTLVVPVPAPVAQGDSHGPACNGPACNGPACNGPACNGPACNGQTCNGQGCAPDKDCNGGGCKSDIDWFGLQRRAPYIYGWADYLYLIPRGADIPYAQPVNGVTPNQAPAGEVAGTTPHYSPGFRAGGGVGIGCKSVLQFTYTDYHTSTFDETAVLPGGNVALRGLLVFPTTFNTAADSLNASATTNTRFCFADIDFKHYLRCNPHWRFAYLLGARYGSLQQDFQANYNITGLTTVNGNVDFTGYGIRVGLEGEYYMPYGAFTYGRGLASLLAGRFSGSYAQNNIFAGQQAFTSFTDDRVVPILELEVGVGWSAWGGRIRLSGGYSFAGWFNTLTLNSLVQGVQATNFTTNTNNYRDTLTFDGFVGRVEFRW
jgi:hypothetical protein